MTDTHAVSGHHYYPWKEFFTGMSTLSSGLGVFEDSVTFSYGSISFRWGLNGHEGLRGE